MEPNWSPTTVQAVRRTTKIGLIERPTWSLLGAPQRRGAHRSSVGFNGNANHSRSPIWIPFLDNAVVAMSAGHRHVPAVA